MRKPFLTIIALLVSLYFSGIRSANATTIFFDVTNIAGNTWEYSYTVENDTLTVDIEEFTVFFDVGLNLDLASAPTGWAPIAIQPDPSLPDDGFYDALALGAGIAPGDSLGGFSVQFDFLGQGTPGAQPFEIVDPFTFDILDAGTTQLMASVPEPQTLWLMALGLVVLVALRKTAVHVSVETPH